MSSTPFVRVVGSVLAACLAVVACVWALPAAAEDTTVQVRDSSYAPQQIEVRPGDVVTWAWVGTKRHSVTSDDGLFDSDPACADADGQRVNCRKKDDADYQHFTWTAPPVAQATTFAYHCKLHVGAGMTGNVVVKPALDPSPSPSPSASPSETKAPKSEPSKSETKEPNPDPEPTSTTGSKRQTDSQDEQSEDDEPSEDPQPETTHGTADDPGIRFGPPQPIDPQPLPTILPSVAPSSPEAPRSGATPDLEDFPDAPTSTPSGSEEPGVVAIDDPGGGLPPRTIWLGIGSASILTAAGAFVKLVLFGAPWA